MSRKDRNFDETVFDTIIKKINVSKAHIKEGAILKDIVTRKETIVNKTPFVIGRSKDCNLCLSDERASRIHSVINQKNNLYIIEDLGSTNGTLLNEHPITKSIMKNGDIITIGNTILLFINK
jgi:pSer/pThr/pTyr-binding forkhead associated (FHA) protein